MYLNMIEKDEEKKVFLQLANIVAISCQHDESGTSEVESGGAAIGYAIGMMFAVTDKTRNVDLEGWKPGVKEKAILEQYCYELGFRESGMFGSLDIGSFEIQRAIEKVEPALKNVRVLDETGWRKGVIDTLVESVVDWTKVADMTPKTGKIMMFELLALALVDGDYAELERYTIGQIAGKLNVDAEELQEMEEFITSYMKVCDAGLDIING